MYQYAMQHKGQGLNCVTILCDSGNRYQSRVLNPEWLQEKGLKAEPHFIWAFC